MIARPRDTRVRQLMHRGRGAVVLHPRLGGDRRAGVSVEVLGDHAAVEHALWNVTAVSVGCASRPGWPSAKAPRPTGRFTGRPLRNGPLGMTGWSSPRLAQSEAHSEPVAYFRVLGCECTQLRPNLSQFCGDTSLLGISGEGCQTLVDRGHLGRDTRVAHASTRCVSARIGPGRRSWYCPPVSRTVSCRRGGNTHRRTRSSGAAHRARLTEDVSAALVDRAPVNRAVVRLGHRQLSSIGARCPARRLGNTLSAMPPLPVAQRTRTFCRQVPSTE